MIWCEQPQLGYKSHMVQHYGSQLTKLTNGQLIYVPNKEKANQNAMLVNVNAEAFA